MVPSVGPSASTTVSILWLCEIKVIFLWQDQRYLNKKSSLPFGLPSPLTVHCVSAIGITQTSPISRTTGSATKSNILPASTRRLLKRCTPAPPSMGSRDSLAGHLDLDHVNCQSHIILMYSPGLPWWLRGKEPSYLFCSYPWGFRR